MSTAFSIFRSKHPIRAHARGEIVRKDRCRFYAESLGKCRPEHHSKRRTCTRLGVISKDPIGFAAGDANLYRYVGNGPTNQADPSGLVGGALPSSVPGSGVTPEQDAINNQAEGYAFINGLAQSLQSLVTLGARDEIEILNVPESHRETYEAARGPYRVLSEIGTGFGVGAAAKLPGVAGKFAFTLGAASNISTAGQGICEGDIWKAGFGIAGVGGNVAGVVRLPVAPRRAVTGMDTQNPMSTLAERQYDAIRALRRSDIDTVARNTGLSVDEVTTMKKHLFFGKHKRFDTGVGEVVRKRFDAQDDIAEAWIRAQNGPLNARQQRWFRQLADHELAERTMMGQGMPFQDLSAWQRVNGQWEHVYREGLKGAHELAPPTPKFWPFWD